MNEINPSGGAKPTAFQSVDLSAAPAEFLITPKRQAGSEGLNALSNNGTNLVHNLKTYSGIDIDIVETRKSRFRPNISAFSGAAPLASRLLVKIDGQKGKELEKQSAQSDAPVWIEQNRLMTHFGDQLSTYYSGVPAGGIFSGNNTTEVNVRVTGSNDQPLSEASVAIHGLGLSPVTAKTTEDGVATVRLSRNSLVRVPAIVIESQFGHWSKIVRNVSLDPDKLNTVRLHTFEEYDATFGKTGAISWGVRSVGALNEIGHDGRGVKVAIIDSGCDASHEYLSHMKAGLDLTKGAAGDSWQTDELAHGTHCAGIIGLSGMYSGSAIRGVAPKVEMKAYKVFPGCDFFILGDAIDAAVADGADVINMSLGSKVSSMEVADSLARARDAGVTVIAAAGNSAGVEQFPANLPTVMAVSALGLQGSFPSDTIHANTVLPNCLTSSGYFSPAFTCFGTSIDFTGPGVGVVSTVPGNVLKALDGTSMAAPHIAGLAALHLAHDPELQNAARTADRVDRVYAGLRGAIMSLPIAAERVGAGMPLSPDVTAPTWVTQGMERFVRTPQYSSTNGAGWLPALNGSSGWGWSHGFH